MKEFILKAILLAGIWVLSFLLLVPILKDGYVDAFYTRFTYPANSLIIGTSRAAQGIQPSVLKEKFGNKYEMPLLNYAFTLSHSPFGPAYLKSIRKKLVAETKNGLFIISVDPWSLSVSANPAVGNATTFPEDNSFVNKLTVVNQAPNFEYLTGHLQKPFYRLWLDNIAPTEKLHKDGWLEIDINMEPKVVRSRTAGKIADYQQKARSEKLSKARMQSLKELIGFLKLHGEVYLVRLPVGPEMFDVEMSYQPAFNEVISGLAVKMDVPYFDYTPLNSQFQTTDGNHLYKNSGRKVSAMIAEDIARTHHPIVRL